MTKQKKILASASRKAQARAKESRVRLSDRLPSDLSLRLSEIHAMVILEGLRRGTQTPEGSNSPTQSNVKSSESKGWSRSPSEHQPCTSK